MACLSMAFGPNFENGPWWFFGGLMFAIVVIASLILVQSIRNNHRDQRALGLLCLLIGHLSLVLAIAYSRGKGGVDAGCESRYTTLLAPIVCTLYFVFGFYLPRHRSRMVQIALGLLFLFLFPVAASDGLTYAKAIQVRREGFEADLRNGRPRFFLVERYYHHPFGLLDWDKRSLFVFFTQLKNARIPPFDTMKDDPAYRESKAVSSGSLFDPESGVFRLACPQKVFALTMVFIAPKPTEVQLTWREATKNNFSVEKSARFTAPTLESIWIDDDIDEIQIRSSGNLEIGADYRFFFAVQ